MKHPCVMAAIAVTIQPATHTKPSRWRVEQYPIRKFLSRTLYETELDALRAYLTSSFPGRQFYVRTAASQGNTLYLLYPCS